MTTLTESRPAPASTAPQSASTAPGPDTAAPAPPALARITGWAAHSPAGTGPLTAARRVLGGNGCSLPAGPDTAGPYVTACQVPDFDRVSALGRRGTRTMDRATALAVATVGALGPDAVGAGSPDPDGTGLVLGTAMGSVQSTMDFTRDALTGERPFLVDPARFPNTVMNFAAGQCAIWHGLRGPNATVIAGRVTGITAARYAVRLLALGHASRVIAGAVEELSPQRARLEAATGPSGAPLLGEGCGVLLLEPAGSGRPGAVGELVAIETGVAPRPEARDRVLRRVVEAALAHLPADTAIQVHAPWDAAPGSAETLVVAGLTAAGPAPRTLDTTAVLGDAGAASAVLQLQVALGALHVAGPPPGAAAAGTDDRYGLVTSVDREGLVGAVLVRHRADPPAGGDR